MRSSSALGKTVPTVEITPVSSNGVWLLARDKELFMSYEDFPQVKFPAGIEPDRKKRRNMIVKTLSQAAVSSQRGARPNWTGSGPAIGLSGLSTPLPSKGPEPWWKPWRFERMSFESNPTGPFQFSRKILNSPCRPLRMPPLEHPQVSR